MSSPSVSTLSPNHLISIGRVIRLHGYKGDLVVLSGAGKDSALGYLKNVWIGSQPESATSFELEEASWMPKGWKITLKDLRDEASAQRLKNQSVFARREDLEPASEDEYYVSDLEGALLVDAETGKERGKFIGLETPASASPGLTDLWWFEIEGEERAVPAVKYYIDRVDPQGRRIYVKNLNELLYELE